MVLSVVGVGATGGVSVVWVREATGNEDHTYDHTSYTVHPSWVTVSSSVVLRTEGHRPIGVSPEEGHKYSQRNRTPLLWRDAEIIGVLQLEKAPRSPYCGLSIYSGGLQTFYQG